MTGSNVAPAGPRDGAVLKLRKVGDVRGRFHVPRYQRGYRWGPVEVERLLGDIWESEGARYCLQPVVVKQRADGDWELVDGQQRFTTLYLVFLYMQREGLQAVGPPFSLTYETRPGSETYLRELDEGRAESNIDFFHLHAAYEVIRAWFEKHEHRRQHVANELYGYLFKSVEVIWYEAPPELDSTTLFTRLNVGRIPLTDAELLKAVWLSQSRGGEGSPNRAHEMAAQWDSIERDLRRPEVWAFVAGTTGEEHPTRITLLLDTLANAPTGAERAPFYTFDTLRKRMGDESPKAVWDDLVDLHALVIGWYESRDLYHKVGYLIAAGQSRFADLVALAKNRAKSRFEEQLDERIRESLELTPSEVMDLGYGSTDERTCGRVLLLMNVETVRRMRDSTERYSFARHASGTWSLEHIHAQNADTLTKAEQWREWLRLHREALSSLPHVDPSTRDTLLREMDAADDIGRDAFQRLSRRVTDVFSHDGEPGETSIHSVHSISNLALLPSRANSALGNNAFEVKRRRILEMDRRGEHIPACTRRVFLKYYTEAGAQQIHFWSAQDREAYLDAMLSPTTGVIHPYLRPEEPSS